MHDHARPPPQAYAPPWQTVVETMTDGVLVVTAKGTIVYANPAAQELMGRANVVGGEFGLPLVSHRRTEIELLGADRVMRCADMRVTPLPSEVASDDLYLVSLRDVTERRRQEAAIQRLNESLQERVKELEDYAHSVSHDLQAPLRSIRTYAAIILEECGEVNPAAREQLERIVVNAERMSDLIRALLRFSRSSLVPLNTRPVALGAVVRDVIQEIKETDASGATFVIGTLPEVSCDRALVAQVFENLFSNAIKYRKPDVAPRITVAHTTVDGMHQFEVRDNGLGFPAEYRERIFRLFERLYSEEEIAGTGVGLSLVQRIVTRHGGRVWADAEPNRGAVFYFTLPVQPEPLAP